MIVFGFDPGFAAAGFAVVSFEPRCVRVIYHETFRTLTVHDDLVRMDQIADRAMDLMERFEPAVVGYEEQSRVLVGKARNNVPVTAASMRVLEVCGIVRAAARWMDLPCYSLATSTVKVAVLGKGGGRAKKDQVKEAVRRIFGVAGCSEHAADAIAVAVAAERAHRREVQQLHAHAQLIH